MTGRTSKVFILIWLSICVTEFCMPMMSRLPLYIFCDAQGDNIVQRFDWQDIDGIVNNSSYDAIHHRLAWRELYDIYHTPLQETQYKYDNILRTRQCTSAYSNLGGDYAVLYPNPYIVVTPKGYTKHYYAGTERLAAVIGSGGLDKMVSPIDRFGSQHEQDIIKPFYTHYQNYDPFYYHGTVRLPEKTEDIAGGTSPDLDYQCKPTELVMVDILPKQDILLGSINQNASINGQEKEVYFYHGDHLGSANWITDFTGTPIQYIHYAPYGELVENQHAAGYDERYKFTGKERDVETGYDYFGARFYWATIGHWLSVDPLADKYPNISPYAYCAWNPVKFVDPDGNEFINKLASPMQIRKNTSLSETQKSAMIQTNTNLNTNLMKRNAIGIDNVFEVFAHGSPQSVMNKLTRITDASQLNSILCASSPYLNSDNNNSSIFIFYACNTGAGENSIAQQFSSVKEVAGSVVIAPTGAVTLDNNGMEYVKNGGEWRVFVDGVQVDAISGKKGMMTKYVKENMSDIDSFLRNCRQKILDEN